MSACITRALAFSATSMANHSLKTDSIHQNSQPIIPTLKRTLSVSVDMASENWMSHTGLKKSSSLENLQLHQDDDNGGPGSGSGIGAETEKPKTQTDIWSSILAQNEQDANKTAPPPYIHPLMKRSSSLSEKSLEICTESLGSETGSDCFLSETGSDSGTEEYKEEVIVEASKETEAEVKVAVAVTPVSTCSVKAKISIARVGSPARSFPPPLPSLAQGGDGANVQMRSHRENGRLVLEAVSVPTNNCLKAKRQDGRLLLTFSDLHVSDSDVADVESEEEEEACHEFENDEVTESESDVEEEDEEEDDDVACEEGGAHKFLGLTRTVNDATWPRKLNRVVNTLEDNDDNVCYGLNPYVYSWKTKPGPGPIVIEAHLGDDVALEGKRAGIVEEEVIIPLYSKGCNLQRQPRRSAWEAHCIAT